MVIYHGTSHKELTQKQIQGLQTQKFPHCIYHWLGGNLASDFEENFR